MMDIILDFSIDENERIQEFINIAKENIEMGLDIIFRINSIHAISNLKLVENFLHHACQNSQLPSLLKLEIVKDLLIYEKKLDDINPKDSQHIKQIKQESNQLVKQYNLE